jgi:hypothetical protein
LGEAKRLVYLAYNAIAVDTNTIAAITNASFFITVVFIYYVVNISKEMG